MKIFKLSELQQLPAIKRLWIWDGILCTGRKRVSLCVGLPHVGKSTFCRQLAIACAQGDAFLGRMTTKCVVAYWQSEETPEDAKEDFTKTGLRPENDENLIICHPEWGESNLEALDKLLTENPNIKLVVIETLDDFLQISDINDNPAVREAFEKFDAKVVSKHAHRCAFLLLHHFKKSEMRGSLNQNRILGGTVISGRTDSKIYLTRVSDQDKRRIIQVEVRKGLSIEPTYLDFDVNAQRYSLGMALLDEAAAKKSDTKKFGEQELKERVLAAIAENPASSKTKIRDLVGGHASNVMSIIAKLIAEGTLVTAKGGATATADLLYIAGTEPQSKVTEPKPMPTQVDGMDKAVAQMEKQIIELAQLVKGRKIPNGGGNYSGIHRFDRPLKDVLVENVAAIVASGGSLEQLLNHFEERYKTAMIQQRDFSPADLSEMTHCLKKGAAGYAGAN